MAIFYPNNPLYYNNSYGEKQIYEALHKLNDDYVVFYSTMWQKKINGDIKWGEADFTIFHKRRGILVVEVKSGDISYKNKEWYQKRLDTGEVHIMQNPLAQADKSKYRFIDLINKNIKSGEKCRVEKIVWFPSISNLDNIFDLPLEYSKNIILTSDSLNDPEASLKICFEHYNMPNNFILSESSIKRIIDILAPEFNLISSPLNRKKEIDYAFLRLTDEQLKLLDYIEEQKFATIQGTAGTGKTLIALEEAKRLSKNGEKVLMLCFNKYLYENLIKNYSIENLDIYNLHTYLMQFNSDLDSDEKLFKVLSSIPYKDFIYDSIIIDEGQDFPEKIIEQFYKISKNIKGKFLIFYDKNQIIYKDKYPNWILNADCKLLLSKNCRNTYQIAITSNNILNLQTVQNNNSIKGEMPNLYIYKESNLIDKLEICINDLRQAGFDLKDIVILTLKSENKSALFNANRIKNYFLNNSMNECSINDIFFTTSRKFKGLESNAIIIIDVDNKTFKEDIEKNNFYVAASRARQRLCIFINENNVDEIANEIKDINLSNSLGKISTKLKVKPLK